jgi:sRNA-binding protein
MNIQIVNDERQVNTTSLSLRKRLRLWCAIFPATFTDPPVPLKIGIHLDLKAQFPQLIERQISAALWLYTRSFPYLGCLKEGAPRFDLLGMQVGIVTSEQAFSAKSLKTHISKKSTARRKARRLEVANRAQPPPRTLHSTS